MNNENQNRDRRILMKELLNDEFLTTLKNYIQNEQFEYAIDLLNSQEAKTALQASSRSECQELLKLSLQSGSVTSNQYQKAQQLIVKLISEHGLSTVSQQNFTYDQLCLLADSGTLTEICIHQQSEFITLLQYLLTSSEVNMANSQRANILVRGNVMNRHISEAAQKTPLHVAIDQHDVDLAHTIIDEVGKKGLTINGAMTDQKDRTLLISAAQKSMRSLVQKLLHFKSITDFIDNYDEEGRTALHYACLFGDPHMATALRDKGASAVVLDKYKFTALAYTVADYGTIHQVLRSEFDGHSQIVTNDSLFQSELASTVNKILDSQISAMEVMLSQNHANNDWLLRYCASKPDKITHLRYLLTNKQGLINIDAGGAQSGMTALHQAVRQQNYKGAYELMKAGASLYQKEKNKGLMPFDLDNGAIANWAFRYAASQKNAMSLLNNLAKHPKVDINRQGGQSGKTALHQAVIAKNYKAVQLLSHLNVNLNSADHKGNTPLHLMAYDADIDAFEALAQPPNQLLLDKANNQQETVKSILETMVNKQSKNASKCLAFLQQQHDESDNMSFQYHWECARSGMGWVKQQFPYGGLNRESVVNNLSQQELINQLSILSTLRSCYDNADTNQHIILQCLRALKGGYCGELATKTASYIREKDPNVNAELVSLDNHELVVIGRRKNSDPKDPRTWGDKAVLCDPWAEKMYPVTDLEKERRPENNIRFFRDPVNRCNLSTEHYLKGTPSIINPFK